MAEQIYRYRQNMICMLTQERKKQKLSQETVAAKMGVQRSNLARFERGEQNPTLDFLIRYAVALGMEPDMVLKSGNPAPMEELPERKERMAYMSYKALLEKADFFKDEINKKRPLSKAEIRELDNYFKVGTTYASNAIEGNTLTLSETKVIIEDGITVGGKPLKFCYEATGHAKAYDYMISVARGDDFRITEEVILKLHKLFYSGIDEEYAGRYRDYQVFITGTEYLPPSPEDVPHLMNDFVSELHQKESVLHPIEYAAYVHRRLVDIGIAADEPKRIKNGCYPLVEWGMTEKDCLDYCYARGFDWGGLYEIFHRVSCWCCPLQALSELRKLYEHFPELWVQLRRWDDSTWRQFRKDYSVRELEIRFALEKEYLSGGKSIRNKDFYNALKQRIADNRTVSA